jgi:hypothetical protein
VSQQAEINKEELERELKELIESQDVYNLEEVNMDIDVINSEISELAPRKVKSLEEKLKELHRIKEIYQLLNTTENTIQHDQ